MKWIRYRFKTKSVDDPRPLIFDAHYPWWCTGYAGDESFATIVAYLPEGENLKTYWDDASEIEAQPKEKIEFSERFPRPEYFVGVSE